MDWVSRCLTRERTGLDPARAHDAPCEMAAPGAERQPPAWWVLHAFTRQSDASQAVAVRLRAKSYVPVAARFYSTPRCARAHHAAGTGGVPRRPPKSCLGGVPKACAAPRVRRRGRPTSAVHWCVRGCDGSSLPRACLTAWKLRESRSA